MGEEKLNLGLTQEMQVIKGNSKNRSKILEIDKTQAHKGLGKGSTVFALILLAFVRCRYLIPESLYDDRLFVF